MLLGRSWFFGSIFEQDDDWFVSSNWLVKGDNLRHRYDESLLATRRRWQIARGRDQDHMRGMTTLARHWQLQNDRGKASELLRIEVVEPTENAVALAIRTTRGGGTRTRTLDGLLEVHGLLAHEQNDQQQQPSGTAGTVLQQPNLPQGKRKSRAPAGLRAAAAQEQGAH